MPQRAWKTPAKCIADVKRTALKTRKRWFPHRWAPIAFSLSGFKQTLVSVSEAMPGTEPSLYSAARAQARRLALSPQVFPAQPSAHCCGYFTYCVYKQTRPLHHPV